MKIPRRVHSAIWAMTSCEGRAVIRVTGEVDVDRSGMLRGSLDSLLRIVTDEDFSGPRGESRRRDLTCPGPSAPVAPEAAGSPRP
jgi:hypothetical protein